MLSFRNAFAIFESAIRDGHASRQQIIDYCDEPYVGRKRELAISVAQHAIGISGERRGIILPGNHDRGRRCVATQQVEFVHPVSGERRRADYVWHTEDGRTIVGELDGQDKYVNPTMTGGHTISDIVEEERLRSDTLRACGVDAVVRFFFSPFFFLTRSGARPPPAHQQIFFLRGRGGEYPFFTAQAFAAPTIGNLRYKRVYTVQDKHGAKILIHIQQHIYEIHEKRLIHDNDLSWISAFVDFQPLSAVFESLIRFRKIPMPNRRSRPKPRRARRNLTQTTRPPSPAPQTPPRRR